MSSRHAGRGWRSAAVWLAGLAALGGCTPEEKVVRYKPFLTGISDPRVSVSHGTAPVNVPPSGREAAAAFDPGELIVENQDGTRTYKTPTIRALMGHVEALLAEDQVEVLYEQLVSERCKEHWRGRGGDERDYIVGYLRRYRRDIARLFGRLPFAEHTPTAVLRRPEPKVWLIELTGKPAEGMKFTRVHAQMERGQWKLLWIN